MIHLSTSLVSVSASLIVPQPGTMEQTVAAWRDERKEVTVVVKHWNNRPEKRSMFEDETAATKSVNLETILEALPDWMASKCYGPNGTLFPM